MLTPQEVSGKAFPRSSFGGSGYQMAAVDEFLDTLTEDYTALYKENATLKSKLKVLAEKIEEYRATEDAMRSTLLSAQRMATKLVQEAEAEKARMLNEAQQEADAKIAELNELTRQAEVRLAEGQKNLSDFVAHARDLCAQEVDFLNALPEMPVESQLPPEEAPAPAAETPEAPEEASAPAAETSEPAEAAAAPAEEPAEEKKAEAPEIGGDTTVFPNDFKLSLDQLKFGRNYEGKN